MAPSAYSGVRVVTELGIEFVELTCPSCGTTQTLTTDEARGKRSTICRNDRCSFKQQVNWLDVLAETMVRKDTRWR